MVKVSTDRSKIEGLLERGIERIYPSKEALFKTLAAGKKLRIYLGVDPTGPHLHLGHLTNLLTLRGFQNLGHEVIFLIGDFTARIGDPSGRLSARRQLSEKEIASNLKTFTEQAAKILRFEGPTKVVLKFNSTWWGKLNFAEIIGIMQHFTIQQVLHRDMFQERIKKDKPIAVPEFFYPLMQGYDSVAMDVDAEIGGTDQTFNMLVGRDLMDIYKKKEKFVITTKLLVNPKTGNKLMNKSEGGLINLDDSSDEMFGKVMALDDESMFPVAELSSEMPLIELETLRRAVASGGNPRDAKLAIASAVTATIHGTSAADKARERFISVFGKKETPHDILTVALKSKKISLVDFLFHAKLATSKSEARRLITQGGVKINQKKVSDWSTKVTLAPGDVIQVGKRKFVKVR